VKVVDLCIVLAGPTCGRTLAEFGADVIRIDSPHVKTVLRHNDINRGKRSILVDLKTKGGTGDLLEARRQADVVLQNFRGGVAERLGIDYERVRARRPDIVYGSMNTFGHIGPYANRPGHEQLGQAVSGMQVRFGSAKPATAPFAANDYGTGLMACYGVALALLHRRRTGQGQFVDSALAYTATMLQSALLQEYKGKEWDEPHGQEATGSGPLNRLYQASDGWLFLAASMGNPDGDLARCAELADLKGLIGVASGANLERALEERLRSRTVAAWVEVLNKAGIGAHRVVPSLPELMTDPLTVARGLAITRDHEGFGPSPLPPRRAAVGYAGDGGTAGGKTRIGHRERPRGNRDERRVRPVDPRESRRGRWCKGRVLRLQLNAPIRCRPGRGQFRSSDELASRHIDDGNLIRARQREIPAAPVGREHDALRTLADAHVRDDFSALRVDHGERVGRDVRDPHLFSVGREADALRLLAADSIVATISSFAVEIYRDLVVERHPDPDFAAVRRDRDRFRALARPGSPSPRRSSG
jgi:crotonobetainyl-CoA:carnitine CoA-transferase CaiB-like acyl-CoA transferase